MIDRTKPVSGGKTAREILERRLKRDLGPIRDMPRDTRRALSNLAKTLQELKGGAAWMSLVGKHAAGRELDGRTWDEMPEVSHG